MDNVTILDAIGMINEEAVREAKAYRRPKSRSWVKWGAVAACLCLVVGLVIPMLNNSGSGPFGNGDATIFEPHREDFSPKIESSIIEQFENNSEVKKAYILRTNDWFLSESLSDFSQVVTTEVVYVAPGDKQGTDNDLVYSFYNVNKDGEIEWNSSAYPPEDAFAPFGFAGLTYEMIDNALAGIEHEDYIITYAPTMSTVFVWVRCATEDVIITYPTRPDLLGIKNGGIYTLKEIQIALSNAYNS